MVRLCDEWEGEGKGGERKYVGGNKKIGVRYERS